MSRFFSEWSALRRFRSLSAKERSITFYAEGPADWPHLSPVIEELTGPLGQHVLYVTSDHKDPVLKHPREGITPFCVGTGIFLTAFFQGLKCRLVVMTLPDLNTFHLKRSFHPVHYVYIFHSINSTHMVYRRGAFDAYDSILCVGPHHVSEIRKTEQVYGLKPKRLVEHGYGRLDTILKRVQSLPPFRPSEGPSKRVVMAPSWGVGSSIEQPYGLDLVMLLLAAGHQTTLRLHPMTVRHRPDLVRQIRQRFEGDGMFRLELDMKAQDSLQQADVMISDWSGAATEFAFGLERPVVYIDTPRKINNPEYAKIQAPPLEDHIRREIGQVVPPDNLQETLTAIQQLCSDPGAYRHALRQARDRWIFNVGSSGRAGALCIAETLEEIQRQRAARSAARGQS